LSKHGSICFKHLSFEKVIDICFKDNKLKYLSVLYLLALLHGIAVTVHQNKLVIYNAKEPFEIVLPNVDLGQQLIDAFRIEAEELHIDVRKFEEMETAPSLLNRVSQYFIILRKIINRMNVYRFIRNRY